MRKSKMSLYGTLILLLVMAVRQTPAPEKQETRHINSVPLAPLLSSYTPSTELWWTRRVVLYIVVGTLTLFNYQTTAILDNPEAIQQVIVWLPNVDVPTALSKRLVWPYSITVSLSSNLLCPYFHSFFFTSFIAFDVKVQRVLKQLFC